ncbi:response regulator [Vibrio sp. T187]|uniref:quorum-sensing autoinducer 2 sensor kinase/phosphatase LuxQ n=1 Tax=Vibrio TaxID=662 RepID=UPI0010C9544C|nr:MULTISPECIES: quorum-sensing autoinducer 2 sensor kinase/phosphatase LuxQ [Vibrio]MBW3695973.1 response regulator [Vibrio sp. T187]
MRKRYSELQRPTLAKLITRIIILVIGMMAVGVLIQNYQTSSKIIQQETSRTVKQTSSLIQNMFDYRLSVLQLHQDSSSNSQALTNFFTTKDQESLSYYFFGIDQKEPDHAPDLRFVTTHDGMVWNDGNSHFYGLSQDNLATLANKVAFSSNWHFIKIDTDIGERHILARRTPVIAPESGEVLGQLYIAIILDNNFSLAESIQKGSNCENIVIEAHGKPVTSTFSGKEEYSVSDVLNYTTHDVDSLGHFVTITTIQINSVETPLIIRAVQKNSNVIELEKNHRQALLLVIFGILMLSILARAWIQKRVSGELDKLMDYTRSASNAEKFNEFDGSAIYEFDHIGRTLEGTFERLVEQNQKLQDLFNFAHSPILVWSDTGNLIQMNPAAELELSKVDASDDQASPDFSPAKTFENDMLQHINMVVQGATLTGINVPIGNKVFRWNLSPIKVEHGISGVVVQGQDITKLIDAEKQSNLARKEAEQLASVRADFLAKMSHEIRTPLNGILGVAQLLKRSIHNEANVEQVDILCNSAEHLLAVLNDILDFSKIEQGQFHIQQKDFKVVELVNTLEKIYQPLCVEKGIELKLDNPIAKETEIYTDQVRLNQILFNLLSNAIKFTPSGEISVELNLETVPNSTKGEFSIVVKDSGIGIREDKLDAVFEPFVQEEPTITREYGGTGLGLAIVKNLVDMLEGDIKVKSEKGNGSTFIVDIPVEIRFAPKLSSVADSESESTDLFDDALKVLLVEDNHTNAFIAQAFCKKYGMIVTWAKDGLEALTSLESESYDLILMDNQLPNLGGIETTQRIRDELKLNTPVYACTADTQKLTRDSFMSAGADYVIVKPIKENDLHQAFVHYKQSFLRA